MNKRKWTNE
jgi:Zn finger protein HypA/HybF involved in hydrogenase expression